MNEIKKILKDKFGYETFRGIQEKVIKRTINNGNSLVLMPTGSGKSLCYQVPALYFEGGTLVISPLIALMQDQVEALKRKNIKAEYINSTVSRKDRELRLEKFVTGKTKLLYVTPERFRKKEFTEAIKKAEISLLAVDEAHCISEWGHDFRPDYSRLGEFRELIGNPLTIALTATATIDVQRDIVEKLGLDVSETKIFHQGIERPNLRLEAEEVRGEKEKIAEIEKVIKDYPGSGIVYFSLIKTLEEYSGMLQAKRIPHDIYHGKLNNRERVKKLRDFISGKTEIMLATNAFGMGIDKPDIRFVIHAEVPSALESYYQEIGRAGRDGKPSLCKLLYDQDDLYTQMEFIKWANPGADFYSRIYNLIKKNRQPVNAYGIEYIREEMSFKNRYDYRVETALALMDRYGVTEGSLERKNLEITSPLPEILQDDEYIEEKLKSDNMKLLGMVNYFRDPKCRRISVSEYFGFHDQQPCGNCDNCDKNGDS